MPPLVLPEPAPPVPANIVAKRAPQHPAELVATSSLGLPAGALWNSALPVSDPAVCSQAIFPDLFAEENSYAFSKTQFSRAALKAAFQHDNLIKMAHNFMPGQPLPDAPSYRPLSAKQKWQLYVRSTHSMGMAASILADGLIAQASGAYPRLDEGMTGFGQRMGVSAAGEETAAFVSGFLFPTLFHQDPRYFRSHETGIINRLAYAASRVIIGRSDDGRTVINTSAISGQFVQAAISNAYIPYRNETVSGTIENALTGLSGVAQAQILNEFWPDIKEFLTKHTPGMKGQTETADPLR